jgi:hypothetical protein
MAKLSDRQVDRLKKKMVLAQGAMNRAVAATTAASKKDESGQLAAALPLMKALVGEFETLSQGIQNAVNRCSAPATDTPAEEQPAPSPQC